MTIFMQGLLNKIFDFIFPPTETELTLRGIDQIVIKNLYRPNQHLGIIFLTNYHEPLIQTAITANKFERNPLAPKILAQFLSLWEQGKNLNLIYVPVPLSSARYRARGHNQVVSILRACPENIKIRTDLLKRVRDTAPQTKLDKHDRAKNLTGAFMANDKIQNLSPDTGLVLVDDVITTGTTLLEAKQALLKKLPPGVKVICLAIAH